MSGDYSFKQYADEQKAAALAQMEYLLAQQNTSVRNAATAMQSAYPRSSTATSSFVSFSLEDILHLADMQVLDLRTIWAARFGDAEVDITALDEAGSFYSAVLMLLVRHGQVERTYAHSHGRAFRLKTE